MGSRKGSTAAQSAGVRYEEALHRRASKQSSSYRPSQRFAYRERDVRKWYEIEVDALFFHEHRVFVLECKRQIIAQAYWQLCKVYVPIIGCYFNRKAIPILVVQTNDPLAAWPEDWERSTLESFFEEPRGPMIVEGKV